jgi:AcrR family transcriptional regulator
MSRKDTILKTATRLFAEKGFKETSVAELSSLSGVAEGTIFYHFKTKEDLLLHILATLKETITTEFRDYRESRTAQAGMEMMEEAISFYLYLTGKLEDEFLLLHHDFIYQLAQVNPTCRGYLQEVYDCLVDIFEEAIEVGRKDGSVSDRSGRKTALLIFTMVDGLVRFKHHNLYNAAALHGELIASCQRMIQPQMHQESSDQ